MSAVHYLVIRPSEDHVEDEPDWQFEITCVMPSLCEGWIECFEKHEVGGKPADAGPYDCDEADPWFEAADEFEFHGVAHEWRYGYGWTVPHPGCVVADSDYFDSAWEIASAHGVGTHVVEADWDDYAWGPTLIWASTLTPSQVPASPVEAAGSPDTITGPAVGGGLS